MPPIWVKICANTNLEDANLAADLGADAVGFVFAPSARQVTAKQVAAILPELPNQLEKVGVFSSQSAEDIIAIVRETGLTGVQLHGGFDVSLAKRLKAALGDTVSIIQTLHWNLEQGAGNEEEITFQLQSLASEPFVQRVLIDSKTKTASGGTGLQFNWSAAAQLLERDGALLDKKVIVAGGLRDHNVAEAILKLKPWGVDVASGVESSPGRKDAYQMERFIRTVREVG